MLECRLATIPPARTMCNSAFAPGAIAFLVSLTLPVPTLGQSDTGAASESRIARVNAATFSASEIATLRVTTDGRVAEYIAPVAVGSVAGLNEQCGEKTYTDPENFVATTPVELNLQAGMIEDEGGAVSFPVDAVLFPLKFEAAECLFAQSNLTPTLTEWSMTLWDGPPVIGQGLPVITIVSDGSVVPHITMPGPGNARATNVRVEVDPNDPEQIFLFNDSGQNMISVSFKIEAHNNPSELPCLLPPDISSNAFMTTDTDSSTATNRQNNWLHAANCGNPCDGTHRFIDLIEDCEPTGDWVMRLTFSCTQTGACCDVDAVCADDITDRDCIDQRGTFMGGDSVCTEVVCPTPVGACCFNGGCLDDLVEGLCLGLSTGFYMGNGSICSEVDCTQGACCFPDGSCQNRVDVQCADAGGVFHSGATCATFTCPQPRGACCIEESCIPDQARDNCENVGGVFVGIGALCAPNPCLGGGCPQTIILSADPPTGTVDARQPSGLDAPLPRLGIGSDTEPITLTLGAAGAAADCFSLCETLTDPVAGVNDIAAVVDLGGGQYEITLSHAIAVGGITQISYVNDPTPVTYMSHPANVNDDSASGPPDILSLIDALNGVFVPPHGLYSTDIDRSGQAGPPDILRLIDLLNGAASFEAWLNSAKPTNGGCP